MQPLFDELRFKPKNHALYVKAFTHTSFANENKLNYSYERLEFLGDAVIEKVVTHYLFDHYPNMNEGDMTKSKIAIVQAVTLTKAAKQLKLQRFIKVGHGLNKSEINDSILEDVFEAFIGAVYLDQGEKIVKQILMKTIIGYFTAHRLDEDVIDYKTLFQESVQKFGKKEISYKLTNKENDIFNVQLWCNGINYASGSAKQLKQAEKAAAKAACFKISKVEA